MVLNETSCGHSDCVALGVTLLGHSRYVCLCPVTFCGYSDCVALSETYVDTADMRGSGCNIMWKQRLCGSEYRKWTQQMCVAVSCNTLWTQQICVALSVTFYGHNDCVTLPCNLLWTQ